MKKITWVKIDEIAVAGDKIIGSFKIKDYYNDETFEREEIYFTAGACKITDKQDIRRDARYFVKNGVCYEIITSKIIKEKLDILKHTEEEIIACFDLEDFYNKKILKLKEKNLCDTKEYQTLVNRKENLKTEEKIRHCCELEEEFLTVFERLPEPYRTIALLKYLRGLTYKEIGSRMGKEEGTIRNLSVTARELIEKEIIKG